MAAGAVVVGGGVGVDVVVVTVDGTAVVGADVDAVVANVSSNKL